MSRRTRAALKAEMVLEDNTAREEAAMKTSTRSQRNREPLRPLTPNSVESADAEKPDQDMAGKKGKKKGKGAKKTAKAAKAGTMPDEENASQQVGDVEDDGEGKNFGDSVASEQGPEHDHDDPKVEYIPNERPASPSVKAGRRTRRQAPEPEPKVRLPEEPATQAGAHIKNAEPEDQKASGTTKPAHVLEPATNLARLVEAGNPTRSGPENATASSQEPTPDAPSLTEESSAAQTPNPNKITSPRGGGVKSPIDAIEAMDALQDELDEVIKGLPNLDDSPDSPVKTTHPPAETARKGTKAAASKTTTASKKPISAAAKTTLNRTPSVRTTTAKLTKTTQPSALSRSNSVKPATKPATNPTTASAARPPPAKPRPSSVIISKEDAPKAPDGKPADYLASRRRPISMQFPTPPAPPKNVKAATKPTFTLPGEAIAARLKAAREERLRREEEEEKKRRAFRARPVPGSVKVGAAVKQTVASRARVSLMGDGVAVGGAEAGKENRGLTANGGAAAGGLKRSSTVTGATSASKRGSVVMGRAAVGAKGKDTVGGAAAKEKDNKRASTAATLTRTASLSVPKRQDNGNASGANRPSVTSGASSSLSNRVPSNASNGGASKSNKGKEVFNRDRLEKEARERDRKEKEEAAKKARAEAAERGRLASREWAERQRRKVEEEKARRAAAEGAVAAGGA